MTLITTYRSRVGSLPTTRIIVSSNAEQYRVVEITGAPNGSYIRERILSKVSAFNRLRIPFNDLECRCAFRTTVFRGTRYTSQKLVLMHWGGHCPTLACLNYVCNTAMLLDRYGSLSRQRQIDHQRGMSPNTLWITIITRGKYFPK